MLKKQTPLYVSIVSLATKEVIERTTIHTGKDFFDFVENYCKTFPRDAQVAAYFECADPEVLLVVEELFELAALHSVLNKIEKTANLGEKILSEIQEKSKKDKKEGE